MQELPFFYFFSFRRDVRDPGMNEWLAGKAANGSDWTTDGYQLSTLNYCLSSPFFLFLPLVFLSFSLSLSSFSLSLFLSPRITPALVVVFVVVVVVVYAPESKVQKLTSKQAAAAAADGSRQQLSCQPRGTSLEPPGLGHSFSAQKTPPADLRRPAKML